MLTLLEAKKQKDFSDDADTILKYDQTLAKFDKGLGYVQGEGLTGPWDGFVKGFLDKVNGNENAAKRLLLEELKVDDILIRIAQTKGAISNKEMEIFARPAPSVRGSSARSPRTGIPPCAPARQSCCGRSPRRQTEFGGTPPCARQSVRRSPSPSSRWTLAAAIKSWRSLKVRQLRSSKPTRRYVPTRARSPIFNSWPGEPLTRIHSGREAANAAGGASNSVFSVPFQRFKKP